MMKSRGGGNWHKLLSENSFGYLVWIIGRASTRNAKSCARVLIVGAKSLRIPIMVTFQFCLVLFDRQPWHVEVPGSTVVESTASVGHCYVLVEHCATGAIMVGSGRNSDKKWLKRCWFKVTTSVINSRGLSVGPVCTQGGSADLFFER